MELIICYAIIYLIEAIILWQYCSNIFYSKLSKHKALFFSIIFYIVPFLTVFQENFLVNSLTFLLSNYLYILFIFQSSYFSALFHATIATIIMTTSELIIPGLIPNLTYNFYDEISYLRNLSILAALSKILYFLTLQILLHFFVKSKEIKQTYNYKIGILVIIPVLTTIISLTFASISATTMLSNTQNYLIAISSILILILIINIMVFSIYNYNQQKSREFAELQLQLQKEYDSAEYYKMLNEQHENQSILIHDIKKHLNSISLLNEQGEQEKVASYIDRIIHSSDLRDSVRMCDNTILNAILSRYLRKCQDTRISFHADIRSGCADFLSEEDLTSLFCNLLDNAYESASRQKDSFIEINMTKKENTVFTILTMTNSCWADPFNPKTKQLVSTKKDTQKHGFGIKSIQRILKKYNGDMKMYYEEESITFHTIIMLKENVKY
uniref:sensor histidine kinase n=1 Tax=Agathobacter sp. TaxID=2021311 RepID=UPI00405751AA